MTTTGLLQDYYRTTTGLLQRTLREPSENLQRTFTEPSDADNGIPNTDFTRGQAWYDLIIVVNPIDASELVIGGINFFMSTQAGGNWKQISKWSEKTSSVGITWPSVLFEAQAKRMPTIK